MSGRLLRLTDCPPQRWKNGLGTTRELAVFPAGATSDDFLWRASIADVDSAGPFSRFPGVDRQILLLDGAGFRMRLDGRTEHALDTLYAPFAFPGEADVSTELLGGPTRDFNLMTRRGRAHGSIEVWRGAATRMTSSDLVLLYGAHGRMTIGDDVIAAGEAWLGRAPEPVPVALDAGAVALAVCMRLNARPGGARPSAYAG